MRWAAAPIVALTVWASGGVSVAEPVDTPLDGVTVFLDPGHQASAVRPDGTTENLGRPVDDGRGGSKPCQTTGMTALGGTPEHTITWTVAQSVAARLGTLGATVVFSRPDDTGWGGCITDRAAAASASGAAVAVSIHADSTSTTADGENHGFHIIVPTLPVPSPVVNDVQAGAGREASTTMRDAYVRAGFTPANYAGTDGIQQRSDIAAPALTTVPVVFIEMGNGANPDDAAVLESDAGRNRHADTITEGIEDFVTS